MNYTISSAEIVTDTSNCDRTPVLVDPKLLKLLNFGVLCKVQLVSEELKLDAYEMLVPKDWKIIKLMVLDECRETIEQIVASNPDCVGYTVVDHWQVIDEAQPF